jgi:hypothetical protein
MYTAEADRLTVDGWVIPRLVERQRKSGAQEEETEVAGRDCNRRTDRFDQVELKKVAFP